MYDCEIQGYWAAYAAKKVKILLDHEKHVANVSKHFGYGWKTDF